MNHRMIVNTIGKMVLLEAGLLLLPLATALVYGESCAVDFLITVGISAAVGLLLVRTVRPRSSVIYAREGFVICAVTWLVFSAIGALPFVLSGEIPNYIDAIFETVSGFTTTGASILTDVESMSHGMLLWRSFTHWVGGMGILVFIVAVLPSTSDRTIHILRAEMPGPTMGKIVPRLRDTAKILYLIYLGMTVVEVILLLAGGMSFFDSLLHTFGTAGTGGFGIKADSIGSYSPYCQWVITIFMALFGINFNLYYLLLVGNVRQVLKSTELRWYLTIMLGSTAIITANIFSMYSGISESLRAAAFQVSSIMTTTGYSTVNFDLWPELSKAILLMLMFIGACAGSTAGGIKVSRIVMMFKIIKRELRRLLHPRSVSTIKFEGKTVDEQTLSSVSNYFLIYIICFVVQLLLVSLDNFDFLTNFTAVASCFNNIGPGLGTVGPLGSFAGYSLFSKAVLSFGMLFGRLEILPMVLAFSPSTWQRSR